jgi:hypothetical protein
MAVSAASGPLVVAPVKLRRLRRALEASVAELDLVPVDETARGRLVEMHADVLIEIASTVSDDLLAELVRLGIRPLDPDVSVAQLRIAHLQLLGWVIGAVAGLEL